MAKTLTPEEKEKVDSLRKMVADLIDQQRVTFNFLCTIIKPAQLTAYTEKYALIDENIGKLNTQIRNILN